MLKALFVNGKFLAQRTTGVQRFARGVITALDRSLQATPCSHVVELLLPHAAIPIDGLRVIRQRVVGPPGRSLTAWEQLDLPRHARGATLLCLSGSAPLLVSDCVPTIHDAAIYFYPKAYSRAFVTWYRLLFSLRAKRSPLVLTVSESSASDLALHLPSTSYRVVPNSAEHIIKQPSDTSILNRLELNSREFLLAVGSLNPTKNFSALINAYATSSLSTYLPLIIVGAMNRDVFRRSSVVMDHPRIRCVGSLPDTQLRALYENAAVFVFPSIYEGFGMPPLEAMLCGCPVVASNVSSIPEVCGDAAQYFDPWNPIEMLSAIEFVVENANNRALLIEKGRKRANEFSWNNSATKLRVALAEFGLIDK
jgi:glycosyltransferase involved in cell wall biosynthesis